MSVTSSAECPTVTRIPAEVHRYTSITVIPMHQNCHCPTNPSVNWETDSVKFKEIYICQISDIFMCLFCIYFFIMFHFPHRTVLSWHTKLQVFALLKHFASSSLWSVDISIGLFLIFQTLTGHFIIIILSFFSSTCVSNVALRRVQNLQKRVLYKVGFWKRWSLERVWRGEGSDNDDNDNNNKVCVCVHPHKKLFWLCVVLCFAMGYVLLFGEIAHKRAHCYYKSLNDNEADFCSAVVYLFHQRWFNIHYTSTFSHMTNTLWKTSDIAEKEKATEEGREVYFFDF